MAPECAGRTGHCRADLLAEQDRQHPAEQSRRPTRSPQNQDRSRGLGAVLIMRARNLADRAFADAHSGNHTNKANCGHVQGVVPRNVEKGGAALLTLSR